MKLLGKYKNGNYNVRIYDNGTKIRYNNLDNLTADFPECIDLNISNRCSHGCSYCYQNCTPNGQIADSKFLEKLAFQFHPFTEIACNINDFNLKEIETFLKICQERNVIVNITINQDEFIKHKKEIIDIINSEKPLFRGVGISLVSGIDSIYNDIKNLNNVVLHTIAGIFDYNDYQKLFDKNLKVLILGYKNKGRGIKYKVNFSSTVDYKIKSIQDNLKELVKHFKVISFDNLAIDQLKLKESEIVDNWEEFYMGDDGQYTFYIDAVKQMYYKSSLELKGFPCENLTIDQMFKHVQSLNNYIKYLES